MDDDRPSLHLLSDDEYIFAAGSNLRIYNDGSGLSHILTPTIPGSTHIRHCTLSSNCALLAVVVESMEASAENAHSPSVFIYQIATQIASPLKPRQCTYHPDPKKVKSGWPEVYFTCCAFSTDSSLLACATNIAELGVLIFDTVLLTVHAVLGTTTLLRGVSFNPNDASKLCVIGESNTLAMWRISDKAAYLSPVHGLTQNKANINQCLVWFDDSRLLIGGSAGYILLLQGCDQIQPPTWAFGVPHGQDRPSQEGYVDSPVMSLLLRGDNVIACGDLNCVSIFEIKRFGASGANGPTAMLNPLKHVRFPQIKRIIGCVWSSRTITSSYNLTIASPDQLFIWDSRADMLGSKAGLWTGDGSQVEKHSVIIHKGKMILPLPAAVSWEEAKADRRLCDFHAGAVHSLALSSRTSQFVTASTADTSVRIRDFSKPTGTSFVWTSFADRKDEIPNSVDMHPSGKYVALAGEDDALECIVTDCNVEVVRRIPAKISFTLPNGAPFVNQAPVSLVRYSHAGQYLAVVTGKLAQIYHLYKYTFSAADVSTSLSIAMTMMDHTGPITDLVFSHDDKRLVTTSQDGSIYEWDFGATSRTPQHEYYMKGIPCTKVAMNNNNLIVAVFNPDPYAYSNNILRRQGTTPAAVTGTPNGGRRSINLGTAASNGDGGISRGISSKFSRRTSVSAGSAYSAQSFESPASRAERGDRASIVDVSETDFVAEEESKQSCVLVLWKDAVSSQPDMTIKLDTPVLSIALGSLDHHDKTDICVLGMSDGRVLISLLPLPLRVLVPAPQLTRGGIGFDLNTHSAQSTSSKFSGGANPPSRSTQGGNKDAEDKGSYLDESHCKVLQLHRSGVTTVSCSASGLWVFSGGADGCTYLIGTSLRAREIADIPERAKALENEYVITEREALSNIRTRICDVDNLIQEKTRESDRIIQKLTDQHEAKANEFEARLKRETKKRDEIIINTREEMIRTNKALNAEILDIKNSQQRKISEIESEYERKLSKESLYLDKMRQAYDEFVLHARMDMQDYEKEIEKTRSNDTAHHNELLKEQENQKKALLAYIEYIKTRNNEILEGLNDAQEIERNSMKTRLKEQKEATEDAAQSGRSEIASLTIETQKLKMEIAKKDNEVMKLNGSIGWANERISKLEAALNEATGLLQKKTEVSDKWELKAGENQQTIVDLERVRKALTSQLHALRQEVMPEKEKLSQVSERLQEVDREYELSLQSISEKEASLVHKGQTLTLLQSQLKDLRQNQSEKERSLIRAAKILGEYKLAFQEARYHATKKSIKTGDKDVEDEGSPKRKQKNKEEVVEVMTKSENMTLAMDRLSALLDPYLLGDRTYVPEEESVAAHEERERHVMQLHKRVSMLKHTLEESEQVALHKVKMAYGDNQKLMEEMNSMRHRIKKLVQENQRQKALIDMMNLRNPNQASSLDVDGSAFGENPNLPSQINSGKLSGSVVNNHVNNKHAGSIPSVQGMQHLYSRDLDDAAYNGSIDSNNVSLNKAYPLEDIQPLDALDQTLVNPPVLGHFTYRDKDKTKVAPSPHLNKLRNAKTPPIKYELEPPLTAESREASMKSADAKIAQIMAENEAKIAALRKVGVSQELTAQDILHSYQHIMSPASATSNAFFADNKTQATAKKVPVKSDPRSANSGPKQPGAQNKDLRSIRGTNVTLPDI